MENKEKLTLQGMRFLDRLGKKNILFSGISGSVSYTPGEDDDIDIFLITDNNRVWSTLLRALLLRITNRNRRICLSFIADRSFAVSLFSGQGDYVMASDAVHMIPFQGMKFYEGLLSISPFVRKYFPEEASEPAGGMTGRKRRFRGPIEYFCFLSLSCWLILKSMYHNRQYIREGKRESIFRPVVSPHAFYFDSVKYHDLRNLLKEWVAEDI